VCAATDTAHPCRLLRLAVIPRFVRLGWESGGPGGTHRLRRTNPASGNFHARLIGHIASTCPGATVDAPSQETAPISNTASALLAKKRFCSGDGRPA
jgi:hypothetical protein